MSSRLMQRKYQTRMKRAQLKYLGVLSSYIHLIVQVGLVHAHNILLFHRFQNVVLSQTLLFSRRLVQRDLGHETGGR